MVSKLALLQLWQSSSSSYLVRTTSPTWRNRTRVARILSCSRRWCVSRIQSDPWTSTRGSWEWGMGEPVKPAQVASPLKIPLSRIDIRHQNLARLLHVMWIYIFEGNIITQKNMSHPLFKEPYCQIMGVFMILVFSCAGCWNDWTFPPWHSPSTSWGMKRRRTSRLMRPREHSGCLWEKLPLNLHSE